MNALSYLGDGEVGDDSGWLRNCTVNCKDSGCVVVRWEHDDGSVYLAVRGTNCRRDAMDDLRVFLGQPPKARIAFLESYIEEHCKEALANDQLMVGGHSLGGLVAKGVASRWGLPGLVQNSPGWLVDPPCATTLSRMIELRTGRDAVGIWGHGVPTTITLHDHEAGTWDLAKLHNIDRQMDLIQKRGLTDFRLDDPELHAQSLENRFDATPGTFGWMKATWDRIHADDMHGRQMAMAPKTRKTP